MPSYICTTCGVSYAPSATPPARCAICEDERQYVNAAGQSWTTLEELRTSHSNKLRELEPDLYGVGTIPAVGIGQRALFIARPGGGVLWDCTALVSDEAVARINELGGLRAIAISHPHFYSTMADWSEAFGGVPIHLHEADREWVMRPSANVRHWSGESLDLGSGVTLVHCGGHFAGSTVLHWSAAAGGKGALMTGDTIQVMPDTRWMSFMYSYPNLIPLPAREVERIAATVAPLAFERIYGGWWDRVCDRDAKARLAKSVERYVAAIS
jgi:glyoxylase-like metal-dependent hydrolase (beta-lactamase superfamily II)